MNSSQKLERIRRHVDESVLLRRGIVERLGEQVLECANLVAGVIGSGGKILLIGNGESSAAASHFAAQLIVRLRPDHTRQALPALVLGTDTSVTTAAAVDLGLKEAYARQVEGLGHKGDLLIVINAGDDHEMLLRAVQAARNRGMLVIGLLGGNNSRLVNATDRALLVPHPLAQRVQEEHLFVIHLLVELIETDLFA